MKVNFNIENVNELADLILNRPILLNICDIIKKVTIQGSYTFAKDLILPS